jgi:diguanylate cyclase (GGDEF)-like protein/PAS domain S-box-containing protein
MPPDRGAYLEAVLEALPDGVVVADERRIIDVNPALCELTGFDEADLVDAKLPYPFFPRDVADPVLAFMRELRENGRAEAELSLLRKDSSRFDALVSGREVTCAEGGFSGRVITVRDITRLRRRELRLAELAAKDELTGLLNKRSFLVRLAGEVARCRRHERALSLAILDLDGFKQVNDAGGHPAGDRVLAEAAGRLGALVRSGEHLARVGGDEFGWILPDADGEGAASAVSRARLAISGEPFRGAGSITLSGGICVTDGTVDAGEVYRRADRALYRAKAGGGNDIVVV